MPAFFQNGVLNEGNTPAAKTGTLAARPAATAVSEGTIYIAYDTQEIFSSQGGAWVKVSGGGGGGSQNLDQVLAVGSVANNKFIQLNGYGAGMNGSGSSGTEISSISLTPFIINREYTNNGFGANKNNFFISEFDANTLRNTLHTLTKNPIIPNSDTEFFYESDNNGKNIFYIRKLNGSANDFRRFVVNASYSGGNTVELTEQTGTQISEIRQEANNGTFQSKIKVSIADSNAGISKYSEINETGFVFEDTQNGNFLTYVTPSFAGNTLQIYFPEYSGVIANVNELVRATGIDLSAGNYDCANYGVYQIDVGDNVRVFDLTNFVSNGVDGQFVTICAADIPVKCFNSAGNIFGTANINSKGLFKLMKIGNDIYSSHI